MKMDLYLQQIYFNIQIIKLRGNVRLNSIKILLTKLIAF